MNDIDLTALRAAAEAATAGEWGVSDDGGGPDLIGYDEDHGDDVFIVRRERRYNTHASKDGKPDARFIAAANPAVVLALLDRLAAAEAAVDRVRNLHDQDTALLAAGAWCPACGDNEPCRTKQALSEES